MDSYQAKYDSTCLNEAIIDGHMERVRDLVENKNVYLNLPDFYGRFPLLIAIETGKRFGMYLLNRPGIDLDVTNLNGMKAIHIAAKYDHLKIIKLLVKKEVNINDEVGFGRGCLGFSALTFAIHSGRPEIIKYLLSLKVIVRPIDVKVLIKRYDQNGYYNLLENLISLSTPYDENDLTQWVIRSITHRYDSKTFRYLLDNYPINIKNVIAYRNKDGCYMIHLAAIKNIEIIRTLLVNGADINQRTSYSRETPLHITVKNDIVKSTELLLDYGADRSLKNDYGKTPLEIAKSNYMVELLTNHYIEDIKEPDVD